MVRSRFENNRNTNTVVVIFYLSVHFCGQPVFESASFDNAQVSYIKTFIIRLRLGGMKSAQAFFYILDATMCYITVFFLNKNGFLSVEK